MKGKKKSLFLVIVLAVLWLGSAKVFAATILPTDVGSASSGCTLLGLEGKYITQIPQALDRINAIRKEACQEGVLNPNTGQPLTASDYVPVKWSSGLEYIARIRAAEASLTMDHVRTNGNSCFDIMSPDHVRSFGEVLAWNNGETMLRGIEQWYGEKEDWVKQNPNKVTGHYTQMINPQNRYVGLGTFCCENTTFYNTTAGEFSPYSNLDETQGTAVDDCIQVLEFKNSYCSGSFAISGDPFAKADEQSQLKFTTSINVSNDWGSTTIQDMQVMGSVSWTSSDDSIASVDFNGMVTAHTCGAVRITAKDTANHTVETEFVSKHKEVIDKAVPATCTASGLTQGKHCSVCGEVITAQKTVPALSHKWDEGKVIKQPTNTSTGEKKYTCLTCRETKTEEIPALSKDIPGKAVLTEISAPAYNKVSLKWKKAINTTNYLVYYKKSGTSKWIKLATVKANTLSYTHTSSDKYPIVVGQKYVYTVRSYNSGSKKYGAYDTRGLTVKTLPSTPKLVKAALNPDNTVTVTWKKAAGCNYYKVFRKTASSKWAQIGTVKSSKLSYNDKTPVWGTDNIYTVRAYYSKTKSTGNYDPKGVSVNVPKNEADITPTPPVPAVPTPIPIPPDVNPVLVRSINLSRHSIRLTAKDQRAWIDSVVLPANAYYRPLAWVSSNPSVVKVNALDGIASSQTSITAVSNGTAVITAYALDGSRVTAQCKVTVDIPKDDTPELPPVPPEQNTQIIKVRSIKLSHTSINLTDKKSGVMIETEITPSNATTPDCRWTSSDDSVAMVNQGWPNMSSRGYVTPVSNGTAVITAHAMDGSGVIAQCVVTVNLS